MTIPRSASPSALKPASQTKARALLYQKYIPNPKGQDTTSKSLKIWVPHGVAAKAAAAVRQRCKIEGIGLQLKFRVQGFGFRGVGLWVQDLGTNALTFLG